MNSLVNQFSSIRSILRHPKLARDEIVSFQNRQLRRLIAHAYENVSYYRWLFDRNGIGPKDIQSIADLSLIPITSKKDIQLLPLDDVVARGIDPESLILHRTSGSSGEPFSIGRTWLEGRVLAMLTNRTSRYLGRRITDKVATVSLVRPKRPKHLRDYLLSKQTLKKLGLFQQTKVDCFLPAKDIIEILRSLRPDILTGFPGVLSKLAQNLGDEDHRAIRPRYIRVGGEVITPLMRRQITEAFCAPVYDKYASWEFSTLAWECKETGEYHTCDDGLILEVIKEGRPAEPGERGEVVGTALHSFAMPLIRYRLGDIVTKGSETCRCGQPFSTIRAIQGRMLDYFPLPGGRMMHPYEIVLPLVSETLWIRQYQLIQEREDRIILRVVPSTTPASQEILWLEEFGAKVVGRGVEFRVILVPDIEVEPSGKFRVSRSFVTSAYDGIEWDQEQDTGLVTTDISRDE